MNDFKITRYLRSDSSENFSTAIVYTVDETDSTVYGAFYGYAGGGEYDGGFFKINSADDINQVLSYDEAEESDKSELFNNLMKICTGYCGEEESSELTEESHALLSTVEADENDEKIFCDDDFDGDIFSEISNMWCISLRFDS